MPTAPPENPPLPEPSSVILSESIEKIGASNLYSFLSLLTHYADEPVVNVKQDCLEFYAAGQNIGYLVNIKAFYDTLTHSVVTGTPFKTKIQSKKLRDLLREVPDNSQIGITITPTSTILTIDTDETQNKLTFNLINSVVEESEFNYEEDFNRLHSTSGSIPTLNLPLDILQSIKSIHKTTKSDIYLQLDSLGNLILKSNDFVGNTGISSIHLDYPHTITVPSAELSKQYAFSFDNLNQLLAPTASKDFSSKFAKFNIVQETGLFKLEMNINMLFIYAYLAPLIIPS